MSTKIYNGYVLPKMTMDRFYRFTQRARASIRKVMFDEYYKIVANILSNCMDRQQLGLEIEEEYRRDDNMVPSENKFSYGKIILFVRDEIKKSQQSMTRDTLLPDFKCEICFFPRKNKTLAILFTESKEATKAWEALREVRPYPYWDNSDEPEDMTWAQWKRRGKEWDMALGNDGDNCPSLNSLMVDCMAGYLNLPFPMRREQLGEFVIPRIKPVKERAKLLAGDHLYEDWSATEGKQYVEESVEKNDWYIPWRHYYRYCDTEEGKAARQKKADEIAPLLRQTITVEDVYGKQDDKT